MFEGGPVPIHPRERPRAGGGGGDAAAGKEAAQWEALVRCGGAGDRAETAEEQRARYAGALEDSPELAPGLSRNALRPGPADLVVVCGLDYTIRTYSPKEDYRLVQVFEGHTNGVNCVEAYGGTVLLSVSDDMTIRRWRLGTQPRGELLLTIWVSPWPLKTICGLPGHRAACGGVERVVRIISLATGATLHRIDDHGRIGPDSNYLQSEGCGGITCLLHLRGNVLCSGSDDTTIRLWDIDRGTSFGTYCGHHGYQDDIGEAHRMYKLSRIYAPVLRLCHLGGDGLKIASASYDRTVAIWDVSDVRNVVVVRTWQAGNNSILYISAISETHLATCGADKEVKFWDWETGDLVCKTETRGIPGAVTMVDDGTVAIGGGDATIRIFRWREGVDLKGKVGFYAMDFCISAMCRAFFVDAEEGLWIRKPILYQTVSKEAGEQEAREAVEVARQHFEDALNFNEGA